MRRAIPPSGAAGSQRPFPNPGDNSLALACSLVAAFLEPTISVVAFLVLTRLFHDPILRSSLTLCLLVGIGGTATMDAGAGLGLTSGRRTTGGQPLPDALRAVAPLSRRAAGS
jgi:hypothetical protein